MDILLSFGREEKEAPEGMVKFLKFVRADLTESEKDFEDAYVNKLQESVRHVKESREMEERFMLFQEMLRDERAEGKAEGKAEYIIDLFEELGSISDELREKIMTEKNWKYLTNGISWQQKQSPWKNF